MKKNLAERISRLNIKSDPDRLTKVLPCKTKRERAIYEAGYNDGYAAGFDDGKKAQKQTLLDLIESFSDE